MVETTLDAPVDVRRLAARIRLHATHMVAIQGFGYLGQALGAADLLAVLFGCGFLRMGWDRFILSPGHYAIAFYAVAAELGLLTQADLATYGQDAALLEAISTERTPLLDLTCGSLGQGLSGAIGFALVARRAGEDRRVYAFLSDGEMEEGQLWEAAMFAGHHRLSNLVALIDANDSQVDGAASWVTTLEPIGDRWRAFGWDVHDIDGHDADALTAALQSAGHSGRPSVVVARTNILGHLSAIPASIDGHFVKLDEALCAAVVSELQSVAG